MKEMSFEKMEEVNGGSWGQDANKCIIDAYTDNGWISLWAFVQTAFIPVTALIIASYCVGATSPD
jgi:hypothetical protein